MYLVVIRSSARKQSICLNPRDHPADVDVLPAAAAAVAALSICSPSQCYVVITVVMEVRNDGRATDRPTGRHIRMDKRRWCCSDRTIGYNRYLSSNPGDAYEIWFFNVSQQDPLDWLVDWLTGWFIRRFFSGCSEEQEEEDGEDEVVGEIEWNLSIHIINTAAQRRGIDRRPDPSRHLDSVPHWTPICN